MRGDLMNKGIAVFELGLAVGLLYHSTKTSNMKTLLYVSSGYLLVGAYLNFNNRVRITI